MKIAYATDNYWPRVSGMAVSIDTFRHELTRMGHEVHVLCGEYPGPLEQDRRAGRRNVHRFKSFRLVFTGEDWLVRPGEKRKVFERLDELQPDLIHAQTEFTMGYLARRYAKERGLPLVMSCHTWFEQYLSHYAPYVPQWLSSLLMRWYSRWAFRHADVLVVPSERMRGVLVGYGITRPIVVIPTGFEQARFMGVDREQERQRSFLFEQYPQLQGRKLLLTVARIGKEKNIDFLLDVVERVVASAPEAMWLLVGDGLYREGFQKRIREKGLQEHVVLTGYLPRERIKHVFALSDVFLFASRTESQGLVTVEAMSCGLPVVAIGEMGTCDVMGGDNGGFMLGEDLELFTSRVLQLLTDPGLYQRKAQEAVHHSRKWSASMLAGKMERLYRLVLEHGTVPPDVEALIEKEEPPLRRASAGG